jgi:hypothetical protein
MPHGYLGAALTVSLLSLSLSLRCFAQAPYEPSPVLKAGDVVTAMPLKTNEYDIAANVTVSYGLNEFALSTIYGPFVVKGNDQLRERVSEIRAISILKRIQGTEAYTTGLENAGKGMYKNMKALVTQPLETLSGIPVGVGRFFTNSYRAIKDPQRSRYEDSTIEQIVGYSKAKRDLAFQVGVDPYSSNERMQDALGDVAWAQYAGGMTVGVVTAIIPAGIGTAICLTNTSVEVSRLIQKESPENLRTINTEKLRKLGASKQQIDAFVGNSWYSPTRQTLLTDALDGMRDVTNVALFLNWAADALSEEQACFVQNSAVLMRLYHANRKPLKELHTAGALPVAETREGALLMALAADYLHWSERTALTTQAVRDDLPARLKDAKMTLLLSGSASPVLRQGLKSLNCEVIENGMVFAAKK